MKNSGVSINNNNHNCNKQAAENDLSRTESMKFVEKTLLLYDANERKKKKQQGKERVRRKEKIKKRKYNVKIQIILWNITTIDIPSADRVPIYDLYHSRYIIHVNCPCNLVFYSARSFFSTNIVNHYIVCAPNNIVQKLWNMIQKYEENNVKQYKKQSNGNIYGVSVL